MTTAHLESGKHATQSKTIPRAGSSSSATISAWPPLTSHPQTPESGSSLVLPQQDREATSSSLMDNKCYAQSGSAERQNLTLQPLRKEKNCSAVGKSQVPGPSLSHVEKQRVHTAHGAGGK